MTISLRRLLSPATLCMAASLATLLACSSGCLFVRHSTNVVRRDEKLARIEYESPEAEGRFTSAVAEKRSDKTFGNPRVTAVPFLLWYSRTDELSDNAVFNDAVAACDVNGDRVISAEEATRFQSRVQSEVAAREEEKREAKELAEGKSTLAGRTGPVARPVSPNSASPPPTAHAATPQQATDVAPHDSAAAYGESRRPDDTALYANPMRPLGEQDRRY